MRVQISPGAFSQCVGIWNTRLIQNQLLNKKRASSNLVTAIHVHMAEQVDAPSLGLGTISVGVRVSLWTLITCQQNWTRYRTSNADSGLRAKLNTKLLIRRLHGRP